MSAPPPPPPPPSDGSGAPHHYPGGRSRQFQRQNVVVSPTNTTTTTATPPTGAPPPSLPAPPTRSPQRHHHHPHSREVSRSPTSSTSSNTQPPTPQQPPPPQQQKQQHREHVTAPRPERVQIGGTEIPFVSEHSPNNNNHDDDDNDSKSGRTATQRRAIRRAGSFLKLSSLSEQMEHWFFTDENLHNAIKKFVKSLPRDLISHHQEGSASAEILGVNLAAQEQHERFCEVFEEQLENMLNQRNVSFEAFTERIRLDKEEEERDGSHFHRWLEVIEFPQFILLLSPPTRLIEELNGDVAAASLQNLLNGIKQLSEEARRKFRKSSILAPLMWAWAPSSFTVFDDVLKASLKDIGLSGGVNDLKLSKTDAKSMIRWRMKLKTPVLNEHGVYTPPPVHHDEFVSYISAVTVSLDEELFDHFVIALRKQINASTATDGQHLAALKKKTCPCPSEKELQASITETEDIMISIEQRLLLEFFFELDARHQGRIPLYSALKFMLQAGALSSEKELKRTMLKYKYTAKKQPGEVFLEHQQEEELKRRRSSLGSNSGSAGLDSRRGSMDLKRGASTLSSDHHNKEEHEQEDENAEDPMVTFHYFLAVVKDALHAVGKGKTVRRVLSDGVGDEQAPSEPTLAPLFKYHEDFVEKINNLRAVWKDKQ